MLIETEQVQLLYTPVKDKPMHLAVFGSGSGTILEALLNAHGQQRKQCYSSAYEIKILFSDRCCRFIDIGYLQDIPVIYHSFRDFRRKLPQAPPECADIRFLYDQENLNLLLEESRRRGFSIDLILLAGYMRIIHPPLLNYFKNRIVNIHPADLTVRPPTGQRAYVGGHAVKDALLAGEAYTRSSVILVDEMIDTGPIIASGPRVTYDDVYPITQESIERHQSKQKSMSDWPVCTEVVQYIADGRIGLDQNNNVYLDGIRQPERGIEIKPLI